MRPLPELEVFSRADARRAGWSDSALSRAARVGRIVALRHGMFTRPGPVAERLAILAAASAIDAVVSHRSGLLLHDLPLVGHRPRYQELTVPPSGTGSAHHVLLHRATLASQDVTCVAGVRTTSVARTLVDVARSRPLVTSVPAFDAALHRGLVTVADIDDVILRCWNWPGIARAQRALRLVDGRAESPLESISRLVIGWLGLPAPELQTVVLDPSGYAVARLDFYWDEFGVAGEADGRLKYDGPGGIIEEKDRQERAEDLGVTFARWGWNLAWRQPHSLRHKIESAFTRGRARDRSGLPRTWSISRTESVR